MTIKGVAENEKVLVCVFAMRVGTARSIPRLQLGNIGNNGGDQVTEHDNHTPETAAPEQQSLSGLLDAPELLRVRILPAQFARALGVSKQSTTRWVRDGWVTLGADGRLDPVVAIGQLLRRCDPGRLRARWLRQAVTEVQELREAAALADERVAAVEADRAAKLAEAQRRIDGMTRYAADADCLIDRILALVIESELAMRATSTSEEFADMVTKIEGAAAEACANEMGDPLDMLDAVDTQPRASHSAEGGAG